MRAAVVKELKKPLVVENVADPTPGADDVVIEVEASGICRSDWHGWQGDQSWLGMVLEPPTILGHEFAGTIVEVGKNVRDFSKGDRVTAPFHSTCGHCGFCLQGRPNICEHVAVYGLSSSIAGSYAEYLAIPAADANLLRLPDSVSSEVAAALGCRYMTGFHAVMRGDPRPGDWLAVQGTGGVGLSAIQTAHAVGAQIIAVDIDDDKLKQARSAGASHTINSETENVPEAIRDITGGGAHVGLDALGIQETIANSINSVRRGGRHVQVGLTGSEEQGMATIPIDMVTAAEIEILGSYGNPQPDFPGLLSLVAQERLTPASLIENRVSLDDVSDVFQRMTAFKTNGFNIITQFQ